MSWEFNFEGKTAISTEIKRLYKISRQGDKK